jgi:hypothetical protein
MRGSPGVARHVHFAASARQSWAIAAGEERDMGTMRWQPAWWNDTHDSAWDRVKEAVRRDWEQTKQDLHIKGGHELNQKIDDTVNQARGKEEIPPYDKPNPPKIIGEWNDLELPIEYGYGARTAYGSRYTGWTRELEDTLEREWKAGEAKSGRPWRDVREAVRRGYEYRH